MLNVSYQLFLLISGKRVLTRALSFVALKTVSLMERLLISKEGLHYDIIYNLINHIGGISNTDSTRRSSVGCCRNCSIRRCDCMCRDYSINYPTLY